MLQRLGSHTLLRKADACASFASCPPISMTNFPRIFAKKFVNIWVPVLIVKPS